MLSVQPAEHMMISVIMPCRNGIWDNLGDGDGGASRVFAVDPKFGGDP